MIVIFLDIDGVLKSLRSIEAFNDFERDKKIKNVEASYVGKTCDPVSIALINKLISKSGAKIVVSSSHRVNFIKLFGPARIPILDLVSLRDYIHGLGIEGEVIDATEDFYFSRRHDGYVRGDEIKMWVDKHPEVTNYLILDDDSDMLEEQIPHFVHTSTFDGLRYENYCRALSILGLPQPTLSPNEYCRTHQNVFKNAAFKMSEVVNYSFNGVRGTGVIVGLTLFSDHNQVYIVEDISKQFPSENYPFSTFPVCHSSLTNG